MTVRKLPDVPLGRPDFSMLEDFSQLALSRWETRRVIDNVQANARVIRIYEKIGKDKKTGEGFSPEDLESHLNALGEGPVTVVIHSPGGNMFDGIAMYAMLRDHPGEVTVKIPGVAASAASVIAMAGDQIEIARPAFLMIHNSRGVFGGDRHELTQFANQMTPFDQAVANIYAARTGLDAATVNNLMDRETWISGVDAVDQRFADVLMDQALVKTASEGAESVSTRRLETALLAFGVSQLEAKELITQATARLNKEAGGSEPDAATQRLNALIHETAILAAHIQSHSHEVLSCT